MALLGLNAALLWGLARAMGLPRGAATVSSLLYAVSFAQLEATLSPARNERLGAVSAALVSLTLYFIGIGRFPRLARTAGLLLLLTGLLAFIAQVPNGRPIPILLQGVTPFVAAVSSSLDPFQAALGMDSTQAGYRIPSRMAIWSVGVAGLLAVHFGSVCRRRQKGSLLAFVGVYFLGAGAESFLFIWPVVALAFGAALVALVGRFRTIVSIGRRGASRLLLGGILLALCLPNLLAVRVARFRGQLANGFSDYAELKARQEDFFTPLFRQGISALKQGQEGAPDLLRKAVRNRPFLLQYLLGPCRLSDLRWITGPQDLRGWLRQVGEKRASGAGRLSPTDRRVLQEMQQEVSDYALCLFCISYLEQRAGRLEESRRWLSQVRFLERDPERLASWIGGLQEVRGDPSLSGFVVNVRDPLYLQDPLPWRTDDYGFGRFLIRMITGWDVGSSWDRQTGFRL